MRVISIIFLLVLSTTLLSQNLIINGSVENFSICHTITSDTAISSVNGWYSPSLNSPDYYNSCAGPLSSGGNFSMPNNSIGYQYPRSGNTYAGFYAYYGTNSNGGKEYIGINLDTNLIANKTYNLRFFYSNAGELIPTQNNPANYYYCSIDSLAIVFTDSVTKYNTYNTIPLNPQVYDTSGYNMDTVIWKEFKGDYTASGNERYIVIGYFNYRGANNIQSSIPLPPNTFMDAYYYLDDVAIWPADTVPPVADAGMDTTICRGGKARLGTHTYNDYIYEWWPAATLSNDSGGVVWASPDTTTTYFLQATDDIYTKTIDSVTVFVNNCGQNDTTVCVEQQFVMGSTNNPLWIYQWSPSTWLSSDTVGMPLCNPLVNQNYQLLITNAVGDTIALDSTNLIVGSCYYAEAGIDSLICKGDSLQIGMQLYSFIDYAWSPNFMISDTAIGNPMVWPDTLTWYFLQVVDTMGNISYDSVLVDVQVCPGFEELVFNGVGFKVYPNPSNDIINFEFSKNLNTNTMIIIYDILGNEVYSNTISQSKLFRLDISNLANGIYFYKINDSERNKASGKFIKQK